MKIYPAEYVVKVYDEFEEKITTCHGITFAKTYAEAARIIEKYYGDDLEDMRIFLLEENELYEIEINQSEHFHGMLKIKDVSLWDEE